MKRPWGWYLEKVLGILLPTSAAGLALTDQAEAREAGDIGIGSSSRLRDIEPVPFSSPLRLDGPDRFAGHRSHSSHSSHRSHYSGSGGSYRSAPSPAPSAAPPAATGAPQTAVPRAGGTGGATDEGLLVAMRAQLELKRLNQYSGPIDGIVGPGTRDALLRFQQAQNLPATGVLDNGTLSKLGIRP